MIKLIIVCCVLAALCVAYIGWITNKPEFAQKLMDLFTWD